MSIDGQGFTEYFEPSSNVGSIKIASKRYYFLLNYLKVLLKESKAIHIRIFKHSHQQIQDVLSANESDNNRIQ